MEDANLFFYFFKNSFKNLFILSECFKGLVYKICEAYCNVCFLVDFTDDVLKSDTEMSFKDDLYLHEKVLITD